MDKPIFEKIERIRQRIYNIVLKEELVVGIELDKDDVFADYDYMVSLKNTENVKNIILNLVKEIETNLKCIKVRILDEQIADEVDDGDEIILVDFYCTIIL